MQKLRVDFSFSGFSTPKTSQFEVPPLPLSVPWYPLSNGEGFKLISLKLWECIKDTHTHTHTHRRTFSFIGIDIII